MFSGPSHGDSASLPGSSRVHSTWTRAWHVAGTHRKCHLLPLPAAALGGQFPHLIHEEAKPQRLKPGVVLPAGLSHRKCHTKCPGRPPRPPAAAGSGFAPRPVGQLACGAALAAMGGHVAHFSGWECGSETSPGSGPFLSNCRCHPSQLPRERPSGPQDTEAWDIQAARTLGDQGLSLLVRLRETEPGKGCEPLRMQDLGAEWAPSSGPSLPNSAAPAASLQCSARMLGCSPRPAP